MFFSRIFVFVLFQSFVSFVQANSNYSACFNQAETNYEQIYCEIKAKGEGSSLPSFFDFKKNNRQMQALLLKRKAEALGIPLIMPSKKNVVSKAQKKVDSLVASTDNSNCQYLNRIIRCEDLVFSIVGNQRNSKLKTDALLGSNKIRLRAFTGNRQNRAQVINYLTASYTRYIEKMLEIGLGGATMSFTKFYYLFQDLSSQGIDFSNRFETMFRYLKSDKRSLGVNEEIDAIEGLTIGHCNRLRHDLFTCDNRLTNRVYVATAKL